MFKMKHPKKKNGKIMAVVPTGDTLVGVLTSPKAVLDKLRKNSRDMKKVYTSNSN